MSRNVDTRTHVHEALTAGDHDQRKGTEQMERSDSFRDILLKIPGQMSRRIAAKDWSDTALGPLERWPQSLRSTVLLVLETRFPTMFYWGPDLNGIYNDAYIPLLGNKPEPLGKPIHQIWSEAWDSIQPSVEKALAGEASSFENAPFTLMRKDQPEQAWFDYCFSPLRNEHGGVAGFLNTAVEKTEQVLDRKEREESETLYRTVAVNLPAGAVFVIDREMRYEIAEGQALAPAGFTSGDLEGRTVREALGPEKAAEYEPLFKQVFAGEPFHLEHESHGRFYISEGVPLRDKRGEVTRALVVSYDITERRRAEQAQRESEERLRLVLENSRDGIHLLDLRQNRYAFMSPSQEELTGFTREELNFSMDEAAARLHPDDVDTVNRYLASVMAGEEPAEPMEYRWKVKSGEYRWFSDSRRAIRDDRGDAVALVGVSRDITDRKQAEEALRRSEEELTRVLEVLPAGVVIADADGRIIRANAATRELWGVPPQTESWEQYGEWVGWWPDTGERIKAEEWAMTRALRHGAETRNEVVRNKKFGSDEQRYYLNNVVPLRDGEGRIIGGVAAMLDMTERRAAEQALQRRTEELAAANRDLESFAYSVSHDLRNPLNNVRMMAAMLSERYRDKLDTKGKQCLAYIDDGVSRMNRTITDLLSLSRVSRRELALEDVDLSAMARDIINELRKGDAQRDVAVVIHQGMHAKADPNLMKPVLSNLIGNAWKYTSKVAHARIEVGARTEDDQTVCFVADNGVGFDMKYADRIFTPFHRAHAERDYTGTGIGLAIVKRAIEKHGGAVWAESAVGEGARFSFTLP